MRSHFFEEHMEQYSAITGGGVIIYVPNDKRFDEAIEEYEDNKSVVEIRLDPAMCERYNDHKPATKEAIKVMNRRKAYEDRKATL